MEESLIEKYKSKIQHLKYKPDGSKYHKIKQHWSESCLNQLKIEQK